MTAAKTTTKKRSNAKSKTVRMRTLRPSPEEFPFFTYRLTQQTVYWLILSLLILALGIWVVTLSVKVQSLYDKVDKASSEMQMAPDHKDKY
jgi:hypothetical protein